jgi:hypothetical protein
MEQKETKQKLMELFEASSRLSLNRRRPNEPSLIQSISMNWSKMNVKPIEIPVMLLWTMEEKKSYDHQQLEYQLQTCLHSALEKSL